MRLYLFFNSNFRGLFREITIKMVFLIFNFDLSKNVKKVIVDDLMEILFKDNFNCVTK